MFRTFRILALTVAVVAFASCGQSAEDGFIGDRLPDQCGADWPVCNTYAGCRLDDESYVSGKLPGDFQFITHTTGAAHIDVAMLVTNAEAQGTETAITFYEPGCGLQYRIAVDGKTFFAESQNEAGTAYVRGQDVAQEGDHLIQVHSDATADYLLKVTVTEQDPTQQ